MDAGLNRVLCAEGEFAEVVSTILGCIGCSEGEGETWASADGRWRHGLLCGAWQKPVAEYLGHKVREEARLRRIAELEAARAAVDDAINALQSERQRIRERILRLAAERENVPASAPLQRAAYTLDGALKASAEARARLGQVDRSLAKAREVETAARKARDRDAEDLGLADWKDQAELDELEKLLGEVRVRGAALWPALDALRNAQYALQKAAVREEDARRALDAAQAGAHNAKRLASEGGGSVQDAECNNRRNGRSSAEAPRRALRDELRHLSKTQEEIRRKIRDLRIDAAVIARDQERSEADRVTHETSRAEAVRRLQLFAEKRLLEVGEGLQPERAELAPSPAVELARRIEQTLSETASDDDAWKRVQSGIQQQYGELNDQLGMRGYHPQAELVDEGVLRSRAPFTVGLTR